MAKSRCPFEIKGEADGKIIYLHFDDVKQTRIVLLREAFKKFHTDTSFVSMKFHLPPSVMEGVSTLEDLKSKIFQYQIELIASEVEFRLFPFLPYQAREFDSSELRNLANAMKYKFFTAYYFSLAMQSCGFGAISFEKVEEWISFVMSQEIQKGKENPQIMIQDELKQKLLTIRLDSIDFHPEEYVEFVGDGNDRRNCFGIVTCPLYPGDFWRHSHDVVIVLSRMKDFLNLTSEERRKIRSKCNSIYRNGGVEIEDVAEDKQSNGLWIPKMIKTPQNP